MEAQQFSITSLKCVEIEYRFFRFLYAEMIHTMDDPLFDFGVATFEMQK